jgi:hypothetical protein
MAKKAFSGDFVHELPKGKVEGYRLWFEYLKFSLREPSAKVQGSIYEPWGDVTAAKFSEWWSKHWRQLFAVPANVRIVDSVDSATQSLTDPDVLIVAIHRAGTDSQRLDDVQKAMRLRFGRSTIKVTEKPQFEIVSKRNVHYPALRSMLRFLQLYAQKKTLEDATVAYMEWVLGWNEKIKGTNREPSHVPKTLERFYKEINFHLEDVKKYGKAKQSQKYNNAKNDARKFLEQGRKVVANVAKGQFPGTY